MRKTNIALKWKRKHHCKNEHQSWETKLCIQILPYTVIFPDARIWLSLHTVAFCKVWKDGGADINSRGKRVEWFLLKNMISTKNTLTFYTSNFSFSCRMCTLIKSTSPTYSPWHDQTWSNKIICCLFFLSISSYRSWIKRHQKVWKFYIGKKSILFLITFLFIAVYLQPLQSVLVTLLWVEGELNCMTGLHTTAMHFLSQCILLA